MKRVFLTIFILAALFCTFAAAVMSGAPAVEGAAELPAATASGEEVNLDTLNVRLLQSVKGINLPALGFLLAGFVALIVGIAISVVRPVPAADAMPAIAPKNRIMEGTYIASMLCGAVLCYTALHLASVKGAALVITILAAIVALQVIIGIILFIVCIRKKPRTVQLLIPAAALHLLCLLFVVGMVIFGLTVKKAG